MTKKHKKNVPEKEKPSHPNRPHIGDDKPRERTPEIDPQDPVHSPELPKNL